MPDSAVHTFSDLDAYHAAIRHAHAECIVTGRGDFGAELTNDGEVHIRGGERFHHRAWRHFNVSHGDEGWSDRIPNQAVPSPGFAGCDPARPRARPRPARIPKIYGRVTCAVRDPHLARA